VIIATALFVFLPAGGYSALNLLLALAGFGAAHLVRWIGKRAITRPRLGQVVFGPTRQRRKRRLATWLGGLVAVQATVVLFTLLGWLKPSPASAPSLLAVATIGALFVGVGMALLSYYQDFPRGYVIGLVMILAVFLMIYLNQPLYPILLGALVAMGLVFLVRFVRAVPLSSSGAPHA
jgi:hypothetical protein